MRRAKQTLPNAVRAALTSSVEKVSATAHHMGTTTALSAIMTIGDVLSKMIDQRPSVLALQPRIIRFRDAPVYLGMDRNRFNAEVRPYLTEVPIGKQGVGFDRLELDAWLDDYVARNGRPAQKGVQRWGANGYPASFSAPGFGTSTSGSIGGEFAKALDQLASRKRSNISQD
jgi:hypothetical protein